LTLKTSCDHLALVPELLARVLHVRLPQHVTEFLHVVRALLDGEDLLRVAPIAHLHLAVVILVDEVLRAEVAEEILDDEAVDVPHGRQAEHERARHLHDVQLLAEVVQVEERTAQRMVHGDGGRAQALRLVGVLRLERVGLLLQIVQ